MCKLLIVRRVKRGHVKRIIEDEYVEKNQKGELLWARENSGKWTANIYWRIHNDLEREGENVDILMYKEKKMEDIEKACGKKTRRVVATSFHWKVGQQEKGSGNRTIMGQRWKRKKVVRQIMRE